MNAAFNDDIGWLEELNRLSHNFEYSNPQEILRWALQTYGDKLTMATAFGAEGCVIIDMLAKLRDEIGITPDLFNLETGYQFPETLQLRERLIEKYGLPIRFVSAKETVAEMEANFGGPIYGSDPNLCCHLRKVVPLKDALGGFSAWITAIRRDQTPERKAAPIVGPDAKFPHLVKVNPLANWSKDQVWDYVRAHDVPTNVLHEQGFPSIGCWPCTRAVATGEDDRSGRWAGTDKRECGLHLGEDGKLTRMAKPVEKVAAPVHF
ncbi:MAG TPA: phosphoadenylyl-sulfate reductase [Abditibacteriaceae bacterium]|nr:phosphoadenylyl-sulfate reductase [Abditibacteriaceae bacterium]